MLNLTQTNPRTTETPSILIGLDMTEMREGRTEKEQLNVNPVSHERRSLLVMHRRRSARLAGRYGC